MEESELATASDEDFDRPKDAKLNSSDSLFDENLAEDKRPWYKNKTLLVIAERWYIICVYALLAFMEGVLYNTWGPISSALERIYNWNNASLSLLVSWWATSYLVAAAVFSFLAASRGLRSIMIIASSFLLAAAVVRCIVTDNSIVASVMFNLSTIFDTFAAPVLYAAPTIVSSIWVPPNQRTFVTSLLVCVGWIGAALAFLVGPVTTITYDVTVNVTINDTSVLALDPLQTMLTRTRLFILFMVEGAFVLLGFIAVMIHFPDKPKEATSATSDAPRDSFCDGMKRLIRNKNFWLLFSSFSFSIGCALSWLSLLKIVIERLNYSPLEAGWLGFWATLASGFVGLALGFVNMLGFKRFKPLIIGNLAVSFVLYGFLALMLMHYLAIYPGWVFFVVIVGYTAAMAVRPLYMELANIVCYPVHEATCSIVLTYGSSAISLIFYVMIIVDPTAPAGIWFIWFPCVSMFISIIPMIFISEDSPRLKLEENMEPVPSSDPDVKEP